MGPAKKEREAIEECFCVIVVASNSGRYAMPPKPPPEKPPEPLPDRLPDLRIKFPPKDLPEPPAKRPPPPPVVDPPPPAARGTSR